MKIKFTLIFPVQSCAGNISELSTFTSNLAYSRFGVLYKNPGYSSDCGFRSAFPLDQIEITLNLHFGSWNKFSRNGHNLSAKTAPQWKGKIWKNCMIYVSSLYLRVVIQFQKKPSGPGDGTAGKKQTKMG